MKRSWYNMLFSPMIAAALLLAPLSVPSVSAAPAASAKAEKSESIQLWVDGNQVKLTAPIYKEDGVAMVPMKDLLDSLAVSYAVEKKTQSIIIRDGSFTITMAFGQKEAIVNGKPVKMDAAAAIKDDVPFVPLRFVAEQLEATVKWDGTIPAIYVNSWYYEEYEQIEDELPEIELPKLTSTEIVEMYDESVVSIVTNWGFGSGIVIGENLVLTNYHVIAEATSATVHSLYDDFTVTGVVAANEITDLAILLTEEPMGLMPIEVDNEYQAQKGDRVYAIGSPLGFHNTVSEGLISNFGFDSGISYIQTNAQIDHGSSGGALFNEYGELVGVTYAGIDGSYADLNFAIAAHQAARLIATVTDEMIEDAEFLTPSLPDTLVGASLEDIRSLMEQEFSSLQTLQGFAEFTKWEAKRDAEGWLVLTANIDPLFYLYYGESASGELSMWAVNMAYELHRMLPDDRIQVTISFERDYGFQPRGLAPGEVTFIEDGKWKVRYPVIDMQLKDQLYIETRM